MKLSVFILSAASVSVVPAPGLGMGQEKASLRTSHCDECLEITVSSTAGAAQRHPHM